MKIELGNLLAHELEPGLLSLQVQLRGLLDEERCRSAVESCLAEVEALRSLARDFLLLSRADVEEKTFLLAPILESLERRFGPLASSRSIRLSIASTPLAAQGDPGATERALSNLLDNAIKFSADGGEVRVGTRGAAGHVVIDVEDRGVGISGADKDRVFEPFVRVDREKPGSGLGLPIARAFVEAQGGTLIVESEPGRGARFVLTLRAA